MRAFVASVTALTVLAGATGLAELCFCFGHHGASINASMGAPMDGDDGCCAAAPDSPLALAGPCPTGCCDADVVMAKDRPGERDRTVGERPPASVATVTWAEPPRETTLTTASVGASSRAPPPAIGRRLAILQIWLC